MNEPLKKATIATKAMYFVAFVAYIFITGLPDVLMLFFDEQFSFYITIFMEFSLSLVSYIYLLDKKPDFKLQVKIKKDRLNKFIKLFIAILLIQVLIYTIRNNNEQIEPEKIELAFIFISCFIVPFYEEVFYRGCLFISLTLFFKDNIKIVYVVTSLFFCLMHTQYYDLIDQIILFIASIIFIHSRTVTKSILFPMITHSAMNLTILFLNSM